MKFVQLSIVSALALSATAANAVTFVTTANPPVSAPSQAVTNGGVTATFTGGVYTGTVAAMNAAQANVPLAARNVRSGPAGLGVVEGPTPTSGEEDQVDSNGANELLEVTFSGTQRFKIDSVILGMLDGNDTFSLFGGNNGVFTRLGFTGAVRGNGFGGGIPVTRTNFGGGRSQLVFNFNGGFDSFRFGTTLEESDGFSFESLSVSAVPEPATWALMILGFGLIGGAMRTSIRKRRELAFA